MAGELLNEVWVAAIELMEALHRAGRLVVVGWVWLYEDGDWCWVLNGQRMRLMALPPSWEGEVRQLTTLRPVHLGVWRGSRFVGEVGPFDGLGPKGLGGVRCGEIVGGLEDATAGVQEALTPRPPLPASRRREVRGLTGEGGGTRERGGGQEADGR